MVDRFTTLLRSCRPLLWVPAAVLAFFAIDAAVIELWLSHASSGQNRWGGRYVQNLDTHDPDLLIIGDSCAHYAGDSLILQEELGANVWNAGSFLDALPGQTGVVKRHMERGSSLDAILLLTTRDALSNPHGARLEFATRQYFMVPDTLLLWKELEPWSWGQLMEFAWSYASGTYAAGKSLERDIKRLLDPLTKGKGPGAVLDKRRRWRDEAAQWEARLESTRGHHRAERKTKNYDKALRTERNTRLKKGRRWKVHPHKQRWINALLQATADNDVDVYWAFCPVVDQLLAHPNWSANYIEPMKAWQAETSARFDHVKFVMTDGYPMKVEELSNTIQHPIAATASRYTEAMATELDAAGIKASLKRSAR